MKEKVYVSYIDFALQLVYVILLRLFCRFSLDVDFATVLELQLQKELIILYIYIKYMKLII